jgi:hypothetical protein
MADGSAFRKRRTVSRTAQNPMGQTRPTDWIGDGAPPKSTSGVQFGLPFRPPSNNPLRPTPGYTPPVPMPTFGEGGFQRGGEPRRTPTFQEQYRIDNGMHPGAANFIYGVDDRDENGNYVDPKEALSPLMGGPRSFNPQNQDVLARAAAALEAVKADRENPMYGGAQGYAAPGQNDGISGTSPIPSLVQRGLQGAADGLNFIQDRLPSMGGGSDTQPLWNPFLGKEFDRRQSGLSALGGMQRGGLVPNPRYIAEDDLTSAQDYGRVVLPQGRPTSSPMGVGSLSNARLPGQRPPLAQPTYPGPQQQGDPQAARIRQSAGMIDDLVARSQKQNPMDTSPQVDPQILGMEDEIMRGRRQRDFLNPNRTPYGSDSTPSAGLPTSSLDAAQIAGSIPTDLYNPITARTANRYDGIVGADRDPLRMTPNQKLRLAEQSAERYMGGGAAADPTNMRGRFGGAYGQTLNNDAAAIRDGRAVRLADGSVVYHTGNQESARAAQLAGKTEREALRDRSRPAATPEEQKRRDAADAAKAAREAKHNAFKAANNGMNYGQYDRMQRQNALTMRAVGEGRLNPMEAQFRMQTRADKALRRAGRADLMSTAGGRPVPGSLFPDPFQKRGGQQAPANPITSMVGPGSTNTLEDRMFRDTKRQENLASSPTLTAMGVTPSHTPEDFVSTVGQYLFEPKAGGWGSLFDPSGDGTYQMKEISDAGLSEIFNHVKLFDKKDGGKPPFPEGSFYNDLWALPADTQPADLRRFFNNILNSMNAAQSGQNTRQAVTPQERFRP